MFNKLKLEKKELFSDNEIVEIDQMLTKYKNKEIQLKELLEYFQIEKFWNYCYDFNCNFIKLLDFEDTNIYCILNRLYDLLAYPQMNRWVQLFDLVKYFHQQDYSKVRTHISGCVWVDPPRVTEINWETFEHDVRMNGERTYEYRSACSIE